jgi:hypothetical protein
MTKQTTTTYGAFAQDAQKTAKLFQKISFGTVTLRVVDGILPLCPEPKIRYTRKPRSHLPGSTREPNARNPPSFSDAMRDFTRDIAALTGTWEVIVKVANGVPVQWDFEEIGSSQAVLNN